MNVEKKADSLQEGQTAKPRVDNGRRAFAKAGVITPVIMSLTSKTALGSIYQCTVSGTQSGNTSSHGNTVPSCSVGISPGGWWQNACKSGNQDGNINEWCLAGVNPFSIKSAPIPPGTTNVDQIEIDGNGTWIQAVNINGSAQWLDVYNAIKSKFGSGALATSFNSIFGTGSTRSVWYVLSLNSGSLEWHAIADYLNAALYANSPATDPALGPVYQDVTPADIVNLYQLAKGVISSFYTAKGGMLITGNFNGGTNGSGVLSYLVGLHASTP